MEQLEDFTTEDAKTCVDWAHSQDNQGLWMKKTMVGLWCMIDVLQSAKNLSDKDKNVNGEKSRASKLRYTQRLVTWRAGKLRPDMFWKEKEELMKGGRCFCQL